MCRRRRSFMCDLNNRSLKDYLVETTLKNPQLILFFVLQCLETIFFQISNYKVKPLSLKTLKMFSYYCQIKQIMSNSSSEIPSPAKHHQSPLLMASTHFWCKSIFSQPLYIRRLGDQSVVYAHKRWTPKGRF